MKPTPKLTTKPASKKLAARKPSRTEAPTPARHQLRAAAQRLEDLAVREGAGRYLVRRPPFTGPVLVDSGPLIALFNAGDHWHVLVLDWLRANPAARLFGTWPVATETCALLASRLHNDAALGFLRWAQRGGIALDSAVEGTLTEVLRLSERFASLPFDLADASVAEAAARLRVRHLLSIDADFDVYRDRAGKPLVNLLR